MTADERVEALAVLLHDEIGGCCVAGLEACVFGGEATREEARRIFTSRAFRAIVAGERSAALREAADRVKWAGDDDDYMAIREWLHMLADRETP